MAYTAGGTIEAWDYNRLTWGGNTSGVYTSTPSNFAYVWGVGSGQFGYGQDASAISTVSAGGTVTATQWSTFVQRLNLALAHQAGAGARLASGSNIGIVAGATIAAFANVATAVTTVNTNKLDFNSTRGATTTGGNLDKAYTNEAATMTHTITVTFASADQARYFFNAGGRLSLVASQAGDFTANDKETNWATLINAVGTIHLDQLTSTRTGTGETLTTNGSAIGYWDLTTSNQTLIRLTDDTAPYTANYIDIFARVAGAAGSNGGLGTEVIFQIDYVDGSADGGFNDGISGTVRNRIDIVKPEITYLADVWGTITVGGA
jgi:hypothetical protein